MVNYVSVDEIVPGMKLADPVTNRYGQVILAAGIELRPQHIGGLKTWGVTLVPVIAESNEVSEYNQQYYEQAREQVADRINWKPRNKIEKDIFNAAVDLAAMQITNNEEGGR